MPIGIKAVCPWFLTLIFSLENKCVINQGLILENEKYLPGRFFLKKKILTVRGGINSDPYS